MAWRIYVVTFLSLFCRFILCLPLPFVPYALTQLDCGLLPLQPRCEAMRPLEPMQRLERYVLCIHNFLQTGSFNCIPMRDRPQATPLIAATPLITLLSGRPYPVKREHALQASH